MTKTIPDKNGLATASFILSILAAIFFFWIPFLFQLITIPLGHAALSRNKKVKAAGGEPSGGILARIGLAVSWALVSIWGLLIAAGSGNLLPVLEGTESFVKQLSDEISQLRPGMTAIVIVAGIVFYVFHRFVIKPRWAKVEAWQEKRLAEHYAEKSKQ